MSPSGTASWSSGDRLAAVATRGRPTAQVVKPFLEAGYGERQILEIVLAVSVKTILKKLSRGLAGPPKHTERCGKDIGRRVAPHRFPKLGDTRYGECVQCVWSVFAAPRVSKALRLGVRLVGPCCLPRA